MSGNITGEKYPEITSQKYLFLQFPKTRDNDKTTIPEQWNHSIDQIHSVVDSYYAVNIIHRYPVTGIALTMADGTILYHTRFKDNVAQSSTETKFVVAAEVGKHILFVYSIADNISYP